MRIAVFVVMLGWSAAFAQSTSTSSTSSTSTSTSSSTSTSTSSTSTSTSTTSLPTCANNGLACNTQCDTRHPCIGAHSGLHFTGNCVGAQNAPLYSPTTPTGCKLTHCGSDSQVCVGGPWTKNGCHFDGDCLPGEACVSSYGLQGCKTSFSECVEICEHGATTTTSTSTSTTSTSTTSTSSTTTTSTSTTSTSSSSTTSTSTTSTSTTSTSTTTTTSTSSTTTSTISGINVDFNVGVGWNGFMRVEFGAFSQDYPIATPANDFSTIVSLTVQLNDNVRVSMLDGGHAPLCLDPGQSFTFNDGAFGAGWSFVSNDVCSPSGFTYRQTQQLIDNFPPASVTANAST